MTVKEVAQKYNDYQIEMRRWFHENPEISEYEYESSAKIKEELDKMGIEWVDCGLETGVLATIKGAKPGKTILLRGDMDALSVTEETGLPFASKNPGKMHACGHDCHMSMLLTAGQILNDMKDELCGTVKLAFQPAEEVGKGAKSMIENGAMEGVDGCFAIHVWGGVGGNVYSCDPGARMAAARRFAIDVQGKSGHGAQPHECVDAVVVGSAIVNNLQSIVSRSMAPADAVVVTVGTFNAGERWNVIAGTAHLEGTSRSFNLDVHRSMPERITKIAENTAAAYGATVKVVDEELVIPVINDEHMVSVVRNAAELALGEGTHIDYPPTSGGEDFAFFMQEAPGAVLLLGIDNEACGAIYGNHHNKFTVDEDMLIKGAQIYAQTALNFNAGM